MNKLPLGISDGKYLAIDSLISSDLLPFNYLITKSQYSLSSILKKCPTDSDSDL